DPPSPLSLAPLPNRCSGMVEVQILLAKIVPLLIYVSFIPSFIVGPIYGYAADRFGRKPILAIVSTGSLLRHATDLSVLLFRLDYRFMLLGRFFSGLSGGFITIMSVTSAYMVDTTSVDNRVSFLATFQGILLLMMTIAELLGGALVKITGSFLPPFLLSSIFSLLAVLYAIFFLPESRVAPPPETFSGDLSNEKGLFENVKSHISQTLSLGRDIPWFTIIPFLIVSAGEVGSVRTYYTNYLFKWTTWEDSIYKSAHGLIAASALALLPLIKKFLEKNEGLKTVNFEEEPLLNNSGLSTSENYESVTPSDDEVEIKTNATMIDMKLKFTQVRIFFLFIALHAVLFSYAGKSWMLFALIPLTAIGELYRVFKTALVADTVTSTRFALLNTILTQLSMIIGVLSSAFYAFVYGKSVSEWPGAVFIVSAGVFFFGFIVSCFMPATSKEMVKKKVLFDLASTSSN
ncbi:hypothetical protein HK096_005697, partial [Nowakowskiella sp. JEL0078]